MNKEMLRVTLKFTMAVIQLILSAISLAFCVKLLLDISRRGEGDNGFDPDYDYDPDSDEKIMFLDF